ncbi:MAG: hypothetical protein ACI80N_002852 [Gammaproteobacteria bacterium]|jgi:hypothetical protein
MTRTFNTVALTIALALSAASDSLAAEQGSAGSGTGLGAPQARTTRADCLNSFRNDLEWCGDNFADDDILREACAAGAQAVLDHCISTL